MTVRQIGVAMDSREFSEWMIFYRMRNEDNAPAKPETHKPDELKDALMSFGKRKK
jgi:hypothetical protein